MTQSDAIAEGTAMGDGGGFDLSKLAVGDEVGIEHEGAGGVSRSVGMVAAICRSGAISLDGGDVFDSSGRCLDAPKHRRLAAPTDEGRINTLREDVQAGLDILGYRRRSMTLPQLRRIYAVLVGLIAESPVGE